MFRLIRPMINISMIKMTGSNINNSGIRPVHTGGKSVSELVSLYATTVIRNKANKSQDLFVIAQRLETLNYPMNKPNEGIMKRLIAGEEIPELTKTTKPQDPLVLSAVINNENKVLDPVSLAALIKKHPYKSLETTYKKNMKESQETFDVLETINLDQYTDFLKLQIEDILTGYNEQIKHKNSINYELLASNLNDIFGLFSKIINTIRENERIELRQKLISTYTLSNQVSNTYDIVVKQHFNITSVINKYHELSGQKSLNAFVPFLLATMLTTGHSIIFDHEKMTLPKFPLEEFTPIIKFDEKALRLFKES